MGSISDAKECAVPLEKVATFSVNMCYLETMTRSVQRQTIFYKMKLFFKRTSHDAQMVDKDFHSVSLCILHRNKHYKLAQELHDWYCTSK